MLILRLSLLLFFIPSLLNAGTSLKWSQDDVTVTVFNNSDLDLLCAGPVHIYFKINGSVFLGSETISKIISSHKKKEYTYKNYTNIVGVITHVECK